VAICRCGRTGTVTLGTDEAHKQITLALRLTATLAEGDSRCGKKLKLADLLARTLLEQRGYADIEVEEAYAKAADWSKTRRRCWMQLAVHLRVMG